MIIIGEISKNEKEDSHLEIKKRVVDQQNKVLSRFFVHKNQL